MTTRKMSGMQHVGDWRAGARSSDQYLPSHAAPSFHHKTGRETYPSPLANPGPYVVREEDAIQGRHYQRPMYSTPHAGKPSTDPKKEQLHRAAGLGVGLTSVVAEHVLSHPCIVLRRQCQVHHDSHWCHLTPFSLVQTLYYMQKNQSLTSLWKGLGSSLLVKGMQVASETVISEVTPLPREVNRHSSIKKLIQHIILKGLGLVVTCPFYAASLVETVQSEIASERPGVLDCVREGFGRLLSLSTPQITRQLPVWKVVGPCVMYGLGHYILASMAQYTVLVSVRSDMKLHGSSQGDGDTGSQEGSLYAAYYPELIATFTGSLLADVALYPLETVLHRLMLQGTRTIIDNTDTGLSVVPIVTRYEGCLDCFRCIIMEEGFAGLYKGFGALVIQYMAHAAILKMTKCLFDALTKQTGKKKTVTIYEGAEQAGPDRGAPV